MKKLVVLLLCLSISTALTSCSFLEKSKGPSVAVSGDDSSNGSNAAGSTWEETASTTSTGPIDPEEPYLYDLSAVNTLNGLFRLNESKQKLRNITDRLDIEGIHSYDDDKFSGHICEAKDAPVVIQQTSGEKLVVVGNEYDGSDQFKVYPASFIGYSNTSAFYRVKLADTIDFMGADVSGISKDYKAVNQALQGTGVSFHRCQDNQSVYRYIELFLSEKKDQTVHYSVYSGTQSKTNFVQMTHSSFLVKDDDMVYAPIQKTQEGYFIIDTSSLKPGIYAVDSSSGWYAVEIQ